MKRYEFFARIAVFANSEAEAESEASDFSNTVNKGDGPTAISIQLEPLVPDEDRWFESEEDD